MDKDEVKKEANTNDVKEAAVAMTTGNMEEEEIDMSPDETDVGDEDGDIDETPEEGVSDEPEPQIKDEEINEVGTDAPTVPSPAKESKSKQRKQAAEIAFEAERRAVFAVERSAIVYLAKYLMAPPDLEDFKRAFPSLF